MMQFRLTPREQDVAELLMQGIRQVDIAERLIISVSVVREHERKIMRKLRVDNRFAAALKLCLVASQSQKSAEMQLETLTTTGKDPN